MPDGETYGQGYFRCRGSRTGLLTHPQVCAPWGDCVRDRTIEINQRVLLTNLRIKRYCLPL